MLGKARPGLTLYLREGLSPALPVLIIGPLFSPTRAHNPWSTAGFYSGHIDDDDRLSFMHAAGYNSWSC